MVGLIKKKPTQNTKPKANPDNLNTTLTQWNAYLSSLLFYG